MYSLYRHSKYEEPNCRKLLVWPQLEIVKSASDVACQCFWSENNPNRVTLSSLSLTILQTYVSVSRHISQWRSRKTYLKLPQKKPLLWELSNVVIVVQSAKRMKFYENARTFNIRIIEEYLNRNYLSAERNYHYFEITEWINESVQQYFLFSVQEH